MRRVIAIYAQAFTESVRVQAEISCWGDVKMEGARFPRQYGILLVALGKQQVSKRVLLGCSIHISGDRYFVHRDRKFT